MKRLLHRWRTALSPASLTTQFALASAGLAAAVLMVGAIGLLWLAEGVLTERESEHSAAMAGTTIRGIASHIDELAHSSLLASALTDSAGRDTYLHPFLSSVHHVNAVPVDILFTDFIGADLASNDYSAFDAADRAWLKAHLAMGMEGARLAVGKRGADVLAVKLIRLPRTLQPEGALLYRFSLASVLYSDKVSFAWNSAAAGLDSPPRSQVAATVDLPAPLDALGLQAGMQQRPITHLFSSSQLILLAGLVLLLSLAVVLLGHRVALVLTRQLRQLEGFAREVVQKGFIRERASISGSDEVAGLSYSINHMLDSLNAQHERLREESERRNRLIGRYRMLIEGTNAVSWEAVPPDGDYSYVSPQAERLLGFGTSEWLQRGFWRRHVHEEDLDAVLRARDEAIGGSMEYSCEYRLRNSSGDAMWVEEIGSVVGDEEGNGNSVPVALRGILLDITQRKAAEYEIQRLAFYDPLTSLPNRRLLLDRLHKLIDGDKASSVHGAILFIDLDNFKTLNDNLGHETGDLLLKEVAQRLQLAVRKSDLVVRLGGDEFVVLLDSGNEPLDVVTRNVEMVAEKILATLCRPYRLNGSEHHGSASIGIYLFDTSRDSVSEMLKRADLAMYQSKAAGRNGIRFFEPEMQVVLSRRAQLEADLRGALRKGEFVLRYQPQVTDTGVLLGFEVLLRWEHPEHGAIAPTDFIHLAEETGLIVEIGMWVLEKACEQLVAWAGRPETAKLRLSVNVSARQFRHPMFVEHTQKIIRYTKVNPRRLRMELTESLLVDDASGTIHKMKMLKSCGLGFSLDDFGTGYSSLSYLRRLPLDELKIDHSFFYNELTKETDAAIVRTIVVLAQSLKLDLIAEGVENERQRAFLAAHGCHAYQGYLFGGPLDEAGLAVYLAQKLSVGTAAGA